MNSKPLHSGRATVHLLLCFAAAVAFLPQAMCPKMTIPLLAAGTLFTIPWDVHSANAANAFRSIVRTHGEHHEGHGLDGAGGRDRAKVLRTYPHDSIPRAESDRIYHERCPIIAKLHCASALKYNDRCPSSAEHTYHRPHLGRMLRRGVFVLLDHLY